MRALYYVFLLALAALIDVSEAEYVYCGNINNENGVIHKYGTRQKTNACWTIHVPEDKYLELTIQYLEFRSKPCHEGYVRIRDKTSGTSHLCIRDSQMLPKILNYDSDAQIEVLLPEAVITYGLFGAETDQAYSYITIYYTMKSLACKQTDSFACSDKTCVYKYQVCNGIKDCDNRKDEDDCGVAAVKGSNVTLTNATDSLRRSGSLQFEWGENTHRAIVALHLSGKVHFENTSMEEELMVKELGNKLLAALLRNSTDHLSAADLSMYVDALIVTCQNPRQFHGQDLVKTMQERVFHDPSPLSGAVLTLCNSNSTIPESVALNLLKLLEEVSEYPFIQDIQATAVMALNCIRRKTISFEEQVSEIINSTTEKFMAGQNSDGGFGTVYSTALITQALLSSGQENNRNWNFSSTVKYLMNQLQLSPDIVEMYLALPILNDKTLLDVSNSHCARSRKTRDGAVSDIGDKPGQKINIQFSLYIGDLKDVVHTIHLRIRETSTAYDVMRLAESNDSKFKFYHRHASDHLYVYSIANILNDPQALKFWLLYAAGSNFDEPVHFKTSPDKFRVKNGMHLIMWYRSLPRQEKDIIEIEYATEEPFVTAEMPEDPSVVWSEMPEVKSEAWTENEQTDVGSEKNISFPTVFSKDQLHILSGLGFKNVK